MERVRLLMLREREGKGCWREGEGKEKGFSMGE